MSDAAGRKGVQSTNRWHDWAAVGLLILHAILAWLNRAFAPGLWRDEAQYLMLARSIREFHYQDVFVLGSPTHSQYPPGFPAFLAFVTLPFGERHDLMIAAVTLCSLATFALLYDLIRRCASSGVALAVLALSVINPELVLHSGRILGEAPYMFLSTLALWAVVRESTGSTEGAKPTWRWPLLAMAAAIAAALTRMVGVTILAAVFLVWLIERRYRRVLVPAVVGTLTVGSWLAWTIIAPAKLVGRSYIADATFSKLEQPSLVSVLADRVTKNGSRYATVFLRKDLPQPSVAVVARHLGASSSGARKLAAVADDVVIVLMVIVLGLAGALVLKRQAQAVVLYLGCYMLLLLVWPWSLARFLVPVLPIILWVFVAGAVDLAARRRWLRPLPFVVGGAILAMAAGRGVTTLRDNVPCDRAKGAPSWGCFSDVERGYFEAMRFIRESTPDSAVFLTAADAQLGYFADRRALFPPRTGARDAAAMLTYMRGHGVEYALLTPVRPPEDQRLSWLKESCRELEVAREFPAITLVLRVVPAGSQPRANACAEIQRYETSDIRSSLW